MGTRPFKAVVSRATPGWLDATTLVAVAPSGLDFGAVLRDELARVDRGFAPDELAFLALTSKIELPIRDRLGYALYRRLPELLVAREWRRVDLAVLARGDEAVPKMLVEATALYTFDLVGDDDWVRRYPDKVERDVKKLCAIKGLPSETQLFALVLATHPTAPADAGLRPVAKYAPGVRNALAALGEARAVAHEAERSVRSHLDHLGPIHGGDINAGAAYGVPVVVHYWLVGPIDQNRPAPAIDA
jgi:hypothetical protein